MRDCGKKRGMLASALDATAAEEEEARLRAMNRSAAIQRESSGVVDLTLPVCEAKRVMK